MKSIWSFWTFALIALGMFSCSDNDKIAIVPSELINLRADTKDKPGYIVLRWETPQDNTIRYVKTSYYNHLLKRSETRLASVYADSVLIPETRRKYGEYVFEVQTVSPSGEVGLAQKVVAVSSPAAKQIALDGRKIKIDLKGEQLYANSDDGSNKIANLVDGNTATIYHGNWANPVPLPNYMVINLQKEITAFTFTYTTRKHSNKDHPKAVNLYGSNAFDGKTYDVSEATLLGSIKSGLPETGDTSYTSSSIVGDRLFRYIWFEVAETLSGNNYYSLSEFSVTELGTTIYDPEAPDVTEK